MASTHGTGRNRTVVTAPDKGSFPLDHFHECEEHAIRYNACLDKHQLMPKRCQKFQINYLECRMKHNLMGKEKIENLGFDQVNSYDNEERVSLSASLILTVFSMWCRGRETCSGNWSRSTRWRRGTCIGCVSQSRLKLTTICIMFDHLNRSSLVRINFAIMIFQ